MLEARHLVQLEVPGHGKGGYLVLESFPHEKRLTLVCTDRGILRYGYKLIVLEKEIEILGEPKKLPADIGQWPYLPAAAYLYAEMLELKTAGDLLGRYDIGNLPGGEPTAYRKQHIHLSTYIKGVSRLFEVAGNPTKEKAQLKEALRIRKEFSAQRVLPVISAVPSRTTRRRIHRKRDLRLNHSRFGNANFAEYTLSQRHVMDLRGAQNRGVKYSLRSVPGFPKIANKKPKARPLTASAAEEVALSEESLMEVVQDYRITKKRIKKKTNNKIPF